MSVGKKNICGRSYWICFPSTHFPPLHFLLFRQNSLTIKAGYARYPYSNPLLLLRSKHVTIAYLASGTQKGKLAIEFSFIIKKKNKKWALFLFIGHFFMHKKSGATVAILQPEGRHHHAGAAEDNRVERWKNLIALMT